MDQALILHLATTGLLLVGLALALRVSDRVLRWALTRVLVVPGMDQEAERIEGLKGTARVGLLLVGLLGGLGISGLSAWLLTQGESLPVWLLTQLASLGPDAWLGMGLKLLIVALLALAWAVAQRVAVALLRTAAQRADDWEALEANDEALTTFFTAAQRDSSRVLALGAASLGARLLTLPESVVGGVDTALRVYLVISLGLALWRALDAMLETLDALAAKYADQRQLTAFYDLLRPLLPVFRTTVEYAIYVSVVSLVLAQVSFTAWLATYGTIALKLLGLFLLTRVVVELAELLVHEVLVARPQLSEAETQRRITVVPLASAVLRYTTYFGAGVFACTQVGIDPAPVLAGAGIVGLAISLGAQKIINDTVSGFLILFEDQFLVGDFIEAGGASGQVLSITFRTTVLRDDEGRVHVVRNGDLTHVINHSREWTYAVVDLLLDYQASLVRAEAVLDALAAEVARWDGVLEAPVRHLEAFEEEAVHLRWRIRVSPGNHLVVARRARREVLVAFQEQGLELYHVRRLEVEWAPSPEISPSEVDS